MATEIIWIPFDREKRYSNRRTSRRFSKVRLDSEGRFPNQMRYRRARHSGCRRRRHSSSATKSKDRLNCRRLWSRGQGYWRALTSASQEGGHSQHCRDRTRHRSTSGRTRWSDTSIPLPRACNAEQSYGCRRAMGQKMTQRSRRHVDK